MELGDRVFGRGLGHVGRAFTNGISVLYKRLQKDPLPFPPCEDSEKAPSKNQEGGPNQKIALIFDFPASQTEQWISVVNKLPSLWYFVVAAQMD